MVIFNCPKCNKIFTKKWNFFCHTEKRKYACVKLDIKNIANFNDCSEIAPNAPKCQKNENICSEIAPNAPKCQKIKQNCSEIAPIDSEHNCTNIIDKDNIELKNSLKHDENETNYVCKYCNKILCKKFNLDRHYERCKVIKKLSEGIGIINFEEDLKNCKSEMKKYKEEMAILVEDHHKLKKSYEELVEKTINENLIKGDNNNQNNKNSNNNNNNQNTQSKNNNSFNTVNNINIIQFGKEDYSKITNQEFSEIMTKFGINIPVSLIEKIHLNDERPEFKNVYVTDINRDKAMVFNGKDWELESFNNIKDDLLDKSIDYIENKCEELKENNKVPEGSKKLMDVKLHSINKLKPFDSEDEEDVLGYKLTKREKTTRKKLRQKAHESIKRKLYNKKEKSKKN